MCVKNSIGNSRAVVLYSGGSDSTLVLLDSMDRYSEVHAVTYYRRLVSRIDPRNRNIEKIQCLYGGSKLVYSEIDFDGLFLDVARGRHIADLRKYGFFTLCLCGACKIAMHVRTLLYCLENNVLNVMDGANTEVVFDPDQRLSVKKHLRGFYGEFGVSFTTPLLDGGLKGLRADYELHRRGFTKVKDLKETSADFQSHCRTICVNDLYAYSFFPEKQDASSFDDLSESYFREKLAYYAREVRKHIEGGGSRLDGLL